MAIAAAVSESMSQSSTNFLFDFDDFWYDGRVGCGGTYDIGLTLIKGQGQGQDRLKVEKTVFFKN